MSQQSSPESAEAEYERLMFGVAERAYFKACETSDPEDWLQAGLMAQQHRNALTKARAAFTAAQSAWQPIETRPEFDHQPGRQFILLEGSCRHSDANWHRQFAGEAYIRKPGQPDEMLQYRMNDILRICQDGDIDPHTARVTHWMPGAYPHFPSSLSSAERPDACTQSQQDRQEESK